MTVVTEVEAAHALPGWHAGGNLLHIPLTDTRDGSTSMWHAIVLRSDRPEIVCLCGSTRFYDEFQQANYDLTMQGKIVLSVGFYPHATGEHGHGEGVGHDSDEKVALDELHKRKIDLADRVHVLNVGGYIGESTRSEIEYAEKVGRPITYLEPLAAAEQGGEASLGTSTATGQAGEAS